MSLPMQLTSLARLRMIALDWLATVVQFLNAIPMGLLVPTPPKPLNVQVAS